MSHQCPPYPQDCNVCGTSIWQDMEDRKDEVRAEAAALGAPEPDFCQECGEDYCECDVADEEEE